MIDYQSLDEVDLCDLIRGGDCSAFNYVYSQHNDKVRSFILSKCHDYLLAEEIAQLQSEDPMLRVPQRYIGPYL